VIFLLLASIGVALILEGFLPQNLPGFLPSALAWRVSAGLLFGLGIGFVSSLLGVAGGELIIPTLVFAFGADIKTAGTASLFISAPTVLVGVLRFASRGAFTERRLLRETVLPMSIGSVLGSIAGGKLVGVIPAETLKVGLGIILIGSAFHIFHRRMALKKTAEAESAPQRSPVSHPEILLATTTSVQDTRMLDSVLPLFEKESGYQVKTVAVGTGRALALARQSAADLVFTHAPEAEKSALQAGTVVSRRLVMHNTFLLAGPAADPAKTKGSLTIAEALAKIAQARALFVSRGDESGTHFFEKHLWEQAGVTPTAPWYVTTNQGMGNTLELAGRTQAYVLTDRATYLAFHERVGLVIVFESNSELFNPYHVLEVNPTKRPSGNPVGGKALADFFLSPTVQKLLSTFGSEQFGQPLFSPACGRTEDMLPRHVLQ
jgi:tungstate transport system substrate-binding protein